MPNLYRGEISLKFARQTIILRPSFEALAEIETVCNKSLIRMLVDFDQQQLRLSEIVAIIKYGAKAHDGKMLTDEQINKLLQDQGIVNILPIMVDFLQRALGLEVYGESN